MIAGDAEAAQHADALKAEVAKLAPMRAACIMPQQLDEAAVEALASELGGFERRVGLCQPCLQGPAQKWRGEPSSGAAVCGGESAGRISPPATQPTLT